MLKSLTVIVTLLIILPIYGQDKGSNASANQGHAKSIEHPDSNPVPTVNQQAPAIQGDSAKHRPERYLYQLISPQNLPNLLLVIIGALGVCAAVKTLRAINHQVLEMKGQRRLMAGTLAAIQEQAGHMGRQNKASMDKERARLSLELVSHDFGDIPSLKYTLTCHGTTPAYVNTSWQITNILPLRDFPWPKEAFGFNMRGIPQVIPSGRIDSETFIMGTDREERSLSIEDSIGRGDEYLHFRVRIVYRDIFDNEHVLSIAKVYGLPPQVGRSPLTRGRPSYPEWQDSIYGYGDDAVAEPN